MNPVHYLASLPIGRRILWCYLLWYLVFVVRYFDPSLRLWLTSLGLSAIIGVALVLSTTAPGQNNSALGSWQTFRLFLMPFCVSSFAALVKGHGFILIFSPKLAEDSVAAGLCLVFWLITGLLKKSRRTLAHAAVGSDKDGVS